LEGFGRRKDVTPPAFGFRVEDTAEGASYRSDAPPGEDTIEQLRRAGLLDDDQ
jgi:hypothetical protein